MYAAYSDKSGTFTRRFQSIALVTGKTDALDELSKLLTHVLAQKQVAEVKFELVRTHAPMLEAAYAFLECLVIQFANVNKARLNVLTWDTQDARHTISGRDDIANLERMYYKMFMHVARQWQVRSTWKFFPDENSHIDWSEFIRILNSAPLTRHRKNPSLFPETQVYQSLKVAEAHPLDSLKEPLIQVADLLAGIARFSREEGAQCVTWLDTWGNKLQPRLPNLCCEEDPNEPIKTKQNRFWLLGEFDRMCKKCKMGVSLREKKCLWTPNGSNSINFWNYEPQHEYDQAPRRANRNGESMSQ